MRRRGRSEQPHLLALHRRCWRIAWFRDQKVLALACLAPFGMAIAAAAMRRYPYGGPVPHGSPACVMQYLAPSICLLAGMGAAVLLARCRNPRRRHRAIQASLVSFALIGIIPIAADALHPYRSVHAQRAREFAQRFWPEFVRDAEPVCLRWDLGIGGWNSTNLNVAVYLCNQMIYSPQRRQPRDRSSPRVSAGRPLRCISPLTDLADSHAATWLNVMKKHYRLTDCRKLAIDMTTPGARPRTELYSVYQFVPTELVSQAQAQADRVGVARPISSILE